ncbi:MAG: pitrilysin family protein [Thiomicrospira sp.]|jgi:zinc protease|nr:pitrilysin family protein [Thiomicrospira sp.]
MKHLINGLILGLVLSLSTASWASVTIQTWHTKKGVKVLFVEAPQLPMVDIEVTFDAGSARDGAQSGLANLTAALLFAGTRTKNEQQISAGFNRLGAQFGGSAGRDSASFTLRSLTRESLLNPALDLFAEVLAQPDFPQEIVERDRARLIMALQQQEEQPNAVAQRQFWQTLYGEHPYATPVEGTAQTLGALNSDDLRAFYARYYVANNAQVAIVGAISRQQAQTIAERVSAGLVQGHAASPLPKPKALAQAQAQVVAFDAEQTHYLLGQVAIERGHPDYYALFLGNHLLGGSGFASLLVNEVREKRGLVYSVYSFFAPMRVAGPWIIGLSTANQQAAQADQVVRETLAKFMRSISADKLADIKSNLIGGWPLRIDSNSEILGYISMIGFYNLPLDYLDAFPRAIEKLSAEDVMAAWLRHIQPDKLLNIQVGQPAPAP